MEKTREQIELDIKKLWDEIYKPEQFRDKEAKDFFQFDFEMMPNFVYQEEQFMERAAQLKERFTKGTANSFFGNQSNNVPIDGLSVFLDQTWTVIKS